MKRSADWEEHFAKLSPREQQRARRATLPKLDRLPSEMLYPTTGWLGDYVLLYQESEAPLGWHFWSGVGLLSIVAGRNLYWDRGNYFLLLNHYLFLLGASGGRKSTTFECARALWKDVAAQFDEYRPDLPNPVYLSPNRITTERLLKDLTSWMSDSPGRRDTRVLIASDELAALLGKSVKGSDRLADFITETYMGKDDYHDATLSGGDRRATNLVVNCLLASTSSSVRRNITEGMFEEGFMGRLLTIARFREEHGVYPTPLPVDPVARRMLASWLVPWLAHDGEIVVDADAAGRAWYDEWYRAHRAPGPPDDPKLASFWSRKHDHVLRLGGILALADHIGAHREPKDVGDRLIVPHATLLKALEILEDEERRLLGAYAEIGAKDDARDQWRVEHHIEKWCGEHGAWYPHGALHRATLHVAGTRFRFAEMMQSLVEQGVVERYDRPAGPKGGRPAVFYKPATLDLPRP